MISNSFTPLDHVSMRAFLFLHMSYLSKSWKDRRVILLLSLPQSANVSRPRDPPPSSLSSPSVYECFAENQMGHEAVQIRIKGTKQTQ